MRARGIAGAALGVAVGMMAAALPLWGAVRPFRIHTDVSKAPEDLAFAEKAKAICEEWYPRINEILFGADRPLPFSDVSIVFEEITIPARTTVTLAPNQAPRCEIMIARNQRERTDDFGGMVIHELTHAVQNTPPRLPDDANWIEEGVCDYVRHKYYEKDIIGKLRVNSTGILHGYTVAEPYYFGLQEKKISLQNKGYRHAYTVASEFFFWLEQTKDREIVPQLCAAMSANKYSPRIFNRRCGVSLDDLWRQFLAWCRR